MRELEKLSEEFKLHSINGKYQNYDELKKLVFHELSPYFTNKKSLELVWEFKQIITEYNMFLNEKNKPFF